ncbi:hypothetical protein CHS0354_028423 [Potamilus streckersoni]|uniref:Uncharacterized protein n=1 Tax=Potamilus streckersoni TaxID=2493646 RepID=A0AAE0VW74_9BIVA|nr:hypothetical protein CHS0354_028423 [Potamilus streckersoni]
MSKSLSKHKVLHCNTPQELLAIVSAPRSFPSYLHSEKVLFPNTNAEKMVASTSRIMYWICPEKLSSYLDLKNHLMDSPHSCKRVICPWCTREQTTYKSNTELKIHVERQHGSLLKALVRAMGSGCPYMGVDYANLNKSSSVGLAVIY